jgi:NAD(P)-dependent dehydrogenase (short-subunit alcohol dehydrogenase family)
MSGIQSTRNALPRSRDLQLDERRQSERATLLHLDAAFSGGMVRDNPETNKHVAEMTALGRAGQPDDIGPMMAALLSEDNRWVNGQGIEVSGGMGL